MQLDSYTFFLFDFDGVLADTEHLHYEAYRAACASYGCTLPWSLHDYLQIAMFSEGGVQEALYRMFPVLRDISWEEFYRRKSHYFLDYLHRGGTLMPGVEKLLSWLTEHDKKIAVVTNSRISQLVYFQEKYPLLAKIPYWMTREKYQLPKPHGECYQKAIVAWGEPHDRVIGFEDSFRGMEALLTIEATAVLVSSVFDLSLWEGAVRKPDLHVTSLALIGDMHEK